MTDDEVVVLPDDFVIGGPMRKKGDQDSDIRETTTSAEKTLYGAAEAPEDDYPDPASVEIYKWIDKNQPKYIIEKGQDDKGVFVKIFLNE